MNRLSIEEIIALEPKIGALLEEARREGPGEFDRLYADYKARLFALVGWVSPHEKLQDLAQYEIVIKALCEALEY